MLKDAFDAGIAAALSRYGVKEAWSMPRLRTAWDPQAGWGTQMLRGLVGHPDVFAREGMSAFGKDGPMNLKNMLWTGKGLSPGFKWMNRASTAMSALPLISAVRGEGDPNEGRLSNFLGTAGSTAGSLLGGQILGLPGGMAGASLGGNLGKGLGRILGSRPKPPPQSEPMEYPSHGYPPQPGGY